MLDFLLSIVSWFIGLIWQKHVTLGERAGQAEQKIADDQNVINIQNKEAQAAANAPTNMEQLIKEQKKGEV
jgi:hypothetical protein